MSVDIRRVQAKILWDKDWGKEQFDSFEAYLASIPVVPVFPEAWRERFNRVILVDARIPLTKACGFAGLKYSGTDATFKDYNTVPARPKVYWLNCRDGRRNCVTAPFAWRHGFLKDERALIAIEGVALYAQDPAVVQGHFVDLPGSVRVGRMRYVACLGEWDDSPELRWDEGDGPDHNYGSASAGVMA